MPMPKRLLFVDDERVIRETLAIILLRYGFSVTLAATVHQAIEHIRNQQFDLLLCDLNIERERDGFEVIRAMREAHPSCLCVVLTGYPDDESILKGVQLGIDEYIRKPADADTLVALLADKLASREEQAFEAKLRTVIRDPALDK